MANEEKWCKLIGKISSELIARLIECSATAEFTITDWLITIPKRKSYYVYIAHRTITTCVSTIAKSITITWTQDKRMIPFAAHTSMRCSCIRWARLNSLELAYEWRMDRAHRTVLLCVFWEKHASSRFVCCVWRNSMDTIECLSLEY